MLCRGELHKIPITQNRIEKKLIADTVAPNSDTCIASRRVIQAAKADTATRRHKLDAWGQ